MVGFKRFSLLTFYPDPRITQVFLDCSPEPVNRKITSAMISTVRHDSNQLLGTGTCQDFQGAGENWIDQVRILPKNGCLLFFSQFTSLLPIDFLEKYGIMTD